MMVAVAAETRISHSVARVSAMPAAVPRSLSCQVCDSRSSVQTKAPARSGRAAGVRQWMIVRWMRVGRPAGGRA